MAECECCVESGTVGADGWAERAGEFSCVRGIAGAGSGAVHIAGGSVLNWTFTNCAIKAGSANNAFFSNTSVTNPNFKFDSCLLQGGDAMEVQSGTWDGLLVNCTLDGQLNTSTVAINIRSIVACGITGVVRTTSGTIQLVGCMFDAPNE